MLILIKYAVNCDLVVIAQFGMDFGGLYLVSF